jgi:hypothetical protein
MKPQKLWMISLGFTVICMIVSMTSYYQAVTLLEGRGDRRLRDGNSAIAGIEAEYQSFHEQMISGQIGGNPQVDETLHALRMYRTCRTLAMVGGVLTVLLLVLGLKSSESA